MKDHLIVRLHLCTCLCLSLSCEMHETDPCSHRQTLEENLQNTRIARIFCVIAGFSKVVAILIYTI